MNRIDTKTRIHDYLRLKRRIFLNSGRCQGAKILAGRVVNRQTCGFVHHQPTLSNGQDRYLKLSGINCDHSCAMLD